MAALLDGFEIFKITNWMNDVCPFMALSFEILLRRLKIWKEQAYAGPFCPDLRKIQK
jgi:hypothetical protein